MAKRILILLVLAGVLIGPEDLSSCGPFLAETVFTSKAVPLDEPRYFSGKLDIVQPHYWRIYLMAAYRYLSGVGLSKADQQALVAPPAPEFGPWAYPTSPAIQGWLDARVQVGAPPLKQIQRFELSPDRFYFVNCGDDAFRNAAATLVERGRTGASHDDLRAWVAAQDQVFANCSHPKGPSTPAALPATAARWMQADRAYQIAAAEFYAGEFAAASADFLRIASDRSSPWHGIAPYLAARAMIRNATLVDASPAPAQEQLRKVLADPDAAPWHESARGLARYLRIQTEPERALRELAHAVATDKTGVASAMNDYRLLLDRYLDRGKRPPLDDDITDWIATVQNGPADHALAKWRASGSLAWLVAALTYAGKPEPDLMAAAAQVREDSPAFMTVEFHRLRLSPADAARLELDAALERKMPMPARNVFRAARMRVARDWDELLRFAPRTETAIGSEGDERDDPVRSAPKLYFDDDAASILNREAPLRTLVQAARSSSLPANLQLQAARAAWVRSILLNDTESARETAPVLSSLAPYLKPYLDGYLAAGDDQARGFAAVWLLLNNPGMRTSVDSGAGRTSSTPLIDSFRDNWWCAADGAKRPMNAPLELLYQGSAPDAGFLSPSQRSEARQEQERLAAAPAAPTFLARKSLEWVETHADDPRAAEALHLVVRAGRYACGGDADTDRWVKRAFRLLHSRYAKSAAARRTPFWYGVGSR
jgi:hypothetical protein